MGFLSKVRTLTLGAAHDVLNATIDLNSPSAVRQVVRDTEAALGELKSNAAIQDGQLRTSIREQGELKAKIETDKATISKLLASSDPAAANIAKAKASTVLAETTRLNEIAANIASQQQVTLQMGQAVAGLEAKHEQMVARVRELERLDRDSKSKEQATAAIKDAGDLAGFGDGPSIDDLQDRMHRRNDVANAKFDQSMGGLQSSSPDSADVDALLASLKPAETVAQ